MTHEQKIEQLTNEYYAMSHAEYDIHIGYEMDFHMHADISLSER